MRISKNFKSEEFDCQDKNRSKYPLKWIPRLKVLCKDLEVIREACGNKRIKIISGYRTKAYNKKVGGAKNSQHLYGRAADFKVIGQHAGKTYEIVLGLRREGKISKGGLGKYRTFTHFDTRGWFANWSGK